MVLNLDTASSSKITVEIISSTGDILETESVETYFGSQTLLPTIVKIIKHNNLTLADISEIKLNTGPGSYTGLKVGAAVANALGYTLNIPINGKKIETDMQYN
jgi:tRNA A37 threonylcarbamoyladenosine modification protein TsaB